MLIHVALHDLQRSLTVALESMSIGSGQFGSPQLVEASSKESEQLFQGFASAKPSKADAYVAALAFMRGQALDSRQRDLVASALAEPIREQAGAKPLGNSRFSLLLESYEKEARDGQLWRLTWYALMSSYFAFDVRNSTAHENDGWHLLRQMLERTWPLIDLETGQTYIPDWVKVLRQESTLFSKSPTAKYARDYLAGSDEAVKSLANDLGISQSSWFWQALVLSAVRSAASASDAAFKKLIPRLIDLVEVRPVFKDEAVEEILNRYYACSEAPLDEHLRNYVVRKDVWRNPKLKSTGIATAWNRVTDPVWLMVLGWVNERNLKDFFDILAARNKADEGRLAFWSKYMKQISWTRLVFGAETMALKNGNPDIRDLIAREEGSYATLTANQSVDAFLMGIGEYIIVEFSKKPNAAYVYRARSTKFNKDSRHFSGGTDDLKYGYYDKNELRITHPPGWQHEAAAGLRRLGISPDAPNARRVEATPVPHVATPPQSNSASTLNSTTTSTGTQTRSVDAAPAGLRGLAVSLEAQIARNAATAPVARVAPPPRQSIASTSSSNVASTGTRTGSVDGAPDGAQFSMMELRFFVQQFPKAQIQDRRGTSGGRLWVVDVQQRIQLADKLKSYGFRWAAAREAWYFPEN